MGIALSTGNASASRRSLPTRSRELTAWPCCARVSGTHSLAGPPESHARKLPRQPCCGADDTASRSTASNGLGRPGRPPPPSSVFGAPSGWARHRERCLAFASMAAKRPSWPPGAGLTLGPASQPPWEPLERHGCQKSWPRTAAPESSAVPPDLVRVCEPTSSTSWDVSIGARTPNALDVLWSHLSGSAVLVPTKREPSP
jgi:hypothetical protein